MLHFSPKARFLGYSAPVFTGIIESTAKILEKSDSGVRVERPKAFDDLEIGSSICVSGACLSAVEIDDESVRFDIVSETLKKTTLGKLKEGDRVNLERSLKSSDRFEGHIVQGHVEGVGKVIEVLQALSPPAPSPEGGGGVDTQEVLVKSKTNKKLLVHARTMRKEPTKAEAVLWGAVRGKQLGCVIRRQYPVRGKILDFYCHQARLGIELDGSVHDGSEQQEYDADREIWLEQAGDIRLLRFKNKEVLNDLPSVIESIKRELLSSPPPVGEGLGERAGTGSAKLNSVTLSVGVPTDLLPLIVPKGSISIDGVSLTVAKKIGSRCLVALIPHTLENTTLGSLKEGDLVNIETDVLGRYIHALHQ